MTTKKYVSLDKLGLYDEKIKKVISDADSQVLADSKTYSDSLSSNYDAVGSAATALADAKAYADGKDVAIAEAKQAGVDAATAAATADGKAVAAQTDVDNLESYVGTFTATEGVDTVVKYIDAKTANVASDETVEAIDERLTQAEADIDNIEKDYLKTADKTELSNAITAEKERAEAAEKVNADAIAAINNETTGILAQAKAYADGKDDAIEAAQAAADAAQAEIDAFLDAAEVGDAAVDTLKEIQAYIESDGEAAAQMTKDIAANATAIEGVAGRMTTAEGEIDTLQSEMDAVEAAVATKVEQTTYDTKVAELVGEDTAIKGRLDALEGAIGESGSVADDIATAKQEAINAAAKDATTKANTAETNAKTYADGLNTAMNTRVEALEAVDHEHANKELLDTYTQTETDLADAVAKKHAHENAAVLNGITAEKVATWDTVSAKATITALEEEVARAKAAEEANAAAIAAYTECSEEEINALFA